MPSPPQHRPLPSHHRTILTLTIPTTSPSSSPPNPLTIPITMSAPHSACRRHYDFFTTTDSSQWSIQSFVQHQMRQFPLRPKPDRFLIASWRQHLKNIVKCRRGCPSSCKDHAEELFEEYRNVLSILPTFAFYSFQVAESGLGDYYPFGECLVTPRRSR